MKKNKMYLMKNKLIFKIYNVMIVIINKWIVI